jgi:hypothetical protein
MGGLRDRFCNLPDLCLVDDQGRRQDERFSKRTHEYPVLEASLCDSARTQTEGLGIGRDVDRADQPEICGCP